MKPKNNIGLKIMFILVLIFLCLSLAYFIILFVSNSFYISDKKINIPVISFKSDDYAMDKLDINKEFDENEEKILSEQNIDLNIILTAKDKEDTKCTYDIYWVYEETMNVNNQYKKISDNEFTIQGSKNDTIIEERQIIDYNQNEPKMLIYSSFIEAKPRTINKEVWNFIIRFYKTEDDQSFHNEKTYNGKLSVENINCISNE